MKPERWNQVEAIFQAALDLKLEDRAAFVEKECGGDPDLKAKVEYLLNNLDSAGSFIENPLWDGNAGSDSKADSSLFETFADLFDNDISTPGLANRIGVFELQQEIGRGGMGTVFLAERADGEFKQKVAIKLIRRGMDTDFIIRRFRHERQIMASFDHPYICRLLDGGRTHDGLPYFVMEYVEGDTLYDYCDRKKLDFTCRIKLFRQICSAISYAHERQIIHRDIKPGNILVTKDGVPKLLDFGIAKILDSDMIHESDSPTSSFVRLMTPDYASPEQMSGKQISAASDIYSLGVLLYELLTGHRPHDFTDMPLHEISGIVCETLPKLPSRILGSDSNLLSRYRSGPGEFARVRSAQTEEIERILKGDLDNIVMKALAKDPSSRYLTVEALSADLQRFLHEEPVRAREFVRADATLFRTQNTGRSKANSLAILPFKYHNLSGSRDTNENFLRIGLADALITRLSRIQRFTVRPTSSILGLDESESDPISAGVALEAEFVLDGSIKRIDERIRVTVQLLDVKNNSAVWATTIDETIADIFGLEDAIATRVVEGLLPQVTGVELEDYSRRGTENAEAFEHYLRGRYYFNSGTEDGLAKAFVCFHDAINADPEYAHAYVGLTDYYSWLGIYGVLPPKDCFAAGIESGLKAVELDENSEQAHAALGFVVHAGRYDWSKAEYHLGRSLEINPNYATAYAWLAIIRYTQGRFADGLDLAARAIELDPLTPFNHHNVGWGLIFARRYDESINQYRQVIEHFPKYGLGYYGISRALRHLGQNEESLSQILHSRMLFGESMLVLTSEAECLAAAGDLEGAKKILEQLDELADRRFVSPYHLALIHCCLGDKEKAIAALEDALEFRDSWLNWMGVDPMLDILRDEPRFQAILEETGYQFFFSDLSVNEGRSTNFGKIGSFSTSETLLFEHDLADSDNVSSSSLRPRSLWRQPSFFAAAAAVLLVLILSVGFLFYPFTQTEESVQVKSASVHPYSIVILPFTSELSADENLGVGLADALSSRLGYVKRISVIAPNSGRSMAKENPARIGSELRTKYVLRGKITRNGGPRVSVEAELVNAAENVSVWLETFTTEDKDFVEIQTKIAESVWKTLNFEPLPTEFLRVSKVYTKSNSAYELYLIGRFLLSTRTPENLKKAIASFSEAAQEDPEFALAYAGLADAYALLNLYEMPPPPDAFENAKKNALKALEIDEDLAEAHTALAYITFYQQKDRKNAELGFRRAIQTNPSYSQAHHWFSILLMAMNRPLESLEEMRTAEQLDPRSLIVRTGLGMIYVYNKRYDDALAECDKVLKVDSGFVPALKVKRWVYQAKGDYGSARETFKKERAYSGGDANHPGWYVIEAQVEAMGRNKKEVIAKLDLAVVEKEVRDYPASYSYEIAIAYNALGESAKAVSWLQKGVLAADNSVNMMPVDPRFENMRNDPRFRAVQNAVFKKSKN